MGLDVIAATLTSDDVGLATSLTLENVPGPSLTGCRQSVLRLTFRAELLAENNPRRVASDCKGVVKALQAMQRGQKQPNGRHRDSKSPYRPRSASLECHFSGLPAPLGQSPPNPPRGGRLP
eukprot:3091578-Amphidinium_carterae.1